MGHVDAARLGEIAGRYGLDLVIQFGSTVTGREHARSDIDLGVRLRRPVSVSEQAALMHELQELCPGRRVDVAFLDHADPLFLKQVTQRCQLLHGSPRRFAEFKIHAFKRYQDHRRYLALERAWVRRTLGEAHP